MNNKVDKGKHKPDNPAANEYYERMLESIDLDDTYDIINIMKASSSIIQCMGDLLVEQTQKVAKDLDYSEKAKEILWDQVPEEDLDKIDHLLDKIDNGSK
tara:strand:- start:198 stop:497 length:300 start_codon:yes stop_codon:yes gene_type:complete